MKDIKTYILENEHFKITFLNIGATIYKWEVKGVKNRNIVLSNDNLNDYQDNTKGYFGATIGRVTNRIKEGKFRLSGKDYQLTKNFENGINAGHGGPGGFAFVFFEVKELTNSLIFSYDSPNDEEGYPGSVHLEVIYEIEGNNLIITYKGDIKGETIMNITNHSYFNLDGTNSVLTHKLIGHNPAYLELNDLNQVTGKLVPTKKTTLDFSKGKTLAEALTHPYVLRNKERGLDFTFYFPEHHLLLEGKDLKLKVTTTYPCIHLYALTVAPSQLLLGDVKIKPHHALAIEPSFETDAINHPTFSNIIFSEKRPYHEIVTYTVSLR